MEKIIEILKRNTEPTRDTYDNLIYILDDTDLSAAADEIEKLFEKKEAENKKLREFAMRYDKPCPEPWVRFIPGKPRASCLEIYEYAKSDKTTFEDPLLSKVLSKNELCINCFARMTLEENK